MSPQLEDIVRKVRSDERIAPAEALVLWHEAPLWLLGELAARRKERVSGDKVYFNRNFHIEPTNLCVFNCNFCSYRRPKGSPEAWDYSLEEVERIARDHAGQGVTEVHIVGGVHPEHDLYYYVEMIRRVKAILPEATVKAFTAIELSYMIRKAGLTIDEGLRLLRSAGMEAIPGGGAEIFDEELRARICPDKGSTAEWFEVHAAAHRLGIPTNATILYGHIECVEHRIDHLDRLRSQQDLTGGFNAFIPLKYRNFGNRMSEIGEVSVTEDLRMLAISRIYLDNIPHIKAYWVMYGKQTAEMALGVLPVNSHALERIARNIALAGDYARTLSRNAAEGRTFTSEELEHLRAFSDATKQLSTQLAALGQSLYDGAVTTTAHVRSTESLENLGSEADLSDTLEAELAALADSFEELPLPIADGSYQVRTAADYAMLAGRDEVTEEQAQAAAAAFLDLDAARLQATGRSEGDVPCWNFDIDDGDDTSYIAVTVSGGEVLRYYSSCAGGEPALSTDEAAEAAAAFLRARGYDGMRLIDTEDAGQSLICTFCYVQDGVLCTADQLRVRVRLDNGTVCGFSSASYLDTHRARTLPADTIGAEAGQAAVPGALQVVDTRTAFLRLYGARETLCYEYLCETDDGQRCVIAVNARTGQQERIQTSDVSGGVQMQF